MTVIGTPRVYQPKFKFTVSIDGFGAAAFQSCSEIAGEHADIDQWEGGVIIPDKQPGRLTIPDVTLMRGATSDRDMFDWFNETTNAAKGTGAAVPVFKRMVDVQQRDRTGAVVKVWRLFNAWPKRFSAGDWDNTADANVIETLVLRYDFFGLPRNS